MFNSTRLDDSNKPEFYKMLRAQLEALLSDDYWLTNLSNAAALLNEHLRDINWVGFYLTRADHTLYLGPFQGRPACLRIPYGRGVCGTAAAQAKTQLVDDVDQFPGHIACDSASRSEVVIPLLLDGRVIGVLDIDAPILRRFEADDARELEELAALLVARTVWPKTFA